MTQCRDVTEFTLTLGSYTGLLCQGLDLEAHYVGRAWVKGSTRSVSKRSADSSTQLETQGTAPTHKPSRRRSRRTFLALSWITVRSDVFRSILHYFAKQIYRFTSVLSSFILLFINKEIKNNNTKLKWLNACNQVILSIIIILSGHHQASSRMYNWLPLKMVVNVKHTSQKHNIKQ